MTRAQLTRMDRIWIARAQMSITWTAVTQNETIRTEEKPNDDGRDVDDSDDSDDSDALEVSSRI